MPHPHHRIPVRALHLAPLALAVALVTTPIAAQEITGVVVDHVTGDPLSNARVTLLDIDRQQYREVLSDTLGRFLLVAPRPGSWLVMAQHLGYAAARSQPVSVAAGERVQLEIRLSMEPIPVDPVVVVGRTPEGNSQIEAFYDRVRQGRRSGLGRFITRAEIEKAAAVEPTDLVRRIPGIQVVGASGGVGSTTRIMTRGCRPAVYVDGMLINHPGTMGSLDELVSLSDVEGIEVYSGPGHAVEGYDNQGCGLIMVWTRRGTTDVHRSSWVRLLIGVSMFLGVLLLH